MVAAQLNIQIFIVMRSRKGEKEVVWERHRYNFLPFSCYLNAKFTSSAFFWSMYSSRTPSSKLKIAGERRRTTRIAAPTRSWQRVTDVDNRDGNSRNDRNGVPLFLSFHPAGSSKDCCFCSFYIIISERRRISHGRITWDACDAPPAPARHS